MKCPIMLKVAATKTAKIHLEDIEMRLKQYLPDDMEQAARDMIVEQTQKRWPLKYPAATIPLLGIPYGISKDKAIDAVSKAMTIKYPEIRRNIKDTEEKTYQRSLEKHKADTERLKATQPERAVGSAVVPAAAALASYFNNRSNQEN